MVPSEFDAKCRAFDQEQSTIFASSCQNVVGSRLAEQPEQSKRGGKGLNNTTEKNATTKQLINVTQCLFCRLSFTLLFSVRTSCNI